MNDYDKMIRVYAGYFKGGPGDSCLLIEYANWVKNMRLISKRLGFDITDNRFEPVFATLDLINIEIEEGRYDV